MERYGTNKRDDHLMRIGIHALPLATFDPGSASQREIHIKGPRRAMCLARNGANQRGIESISLHDVDQIKERATDTANRRNAVCRLQQRHSAGSDFVQKCVARTRLNNI